MNIRIFRERPLRDYFKELSSAFHREVEGEDRNKLLNMNEAAYIAYLVDRFRIKPLVFLWDKLSVTDQEQIFQGRTRQHVIRYYIPYEGDKELLRCSPDSGLLWFTQVVLEDNCVCFDVVDWAMSADGVKREAESIIDPIRQQAENVAKEVDKYNAELGSVDISP
jgi:hypothetical protein